KLMTDAGLWMPRRQRPPKVYQSPARRTCPGYQSPPYPARRSNRNRSTSVPRNAARSAQPRKRANKRREAGAPTAPPPAPPPRPAQIATSGGA
ncbi:hypothetical protein DN536_31155, partial [Burkholderia multivorans]